MVDLSGKVAIVTGSSRGIGKGIAVKLAEYGAKVTINYVSNEAEANKIVTQIGRDRAISVRASVEDPLQADLLVRETIDKFGKVDILVNNAGICPFKPFFELTPEDWFRTINTNLSGPFFVSQSASRYMKKNGGAIINIGSIGIFLGTRNQVHYNSSKGGLFSMTNTMAFELGEYGIRVNCLAVGGIPTDINKDQYTGEYLSWLKSKLPLHTMGKPEDIGELTAFLSSDLSKWITGACIAVDGGRLIAP